MLMPICIKYKLNIPFLSYTKKRDTWLDDNILKNIFNENYFKDLFELLRA